MKTARYGDRGREQEHTRRKERKHIKEYFRRRIRRKEGRDRDRVRGEK